MARTRVVIVGLLRDGASTLPRIQKQVEQVGRQFLDYHVLIVENDSSDDTREKLLEWHRRNPRVDILGCGVNAPSCQINLPRTEGHPIEQSRMAKMAYLRNLYLEHLRQHHSDFDYVLVWDLDLEARLTGLASSFDFFRSHPKAEAVCAYGYFPSSAGPIYFDTFAHEDDVPYDHRAHRQHSLRTRYKHRYGCTDPVAVKSCFGGLTIYRTTALLPHNYEVAPEPTCEHTLLHRHLNQIFLNPRMRLAIANNP